MERIFTLLAVCSALAATGAHAADMTFKIGKKDWIYAKGAITSQTPDALERFLRAYPESRWINLDSEGGEVIAAMELGRVIRKHHINTYVGGLYRNGKIAAENLDGTDECYSACVWAFAGGETRVFEGQGGILGVHQMHGEKPIGESNQQMLTQYVIAMLGRYLDEMGVSRELLDASLMTTPETIQPVTFMLAKRWRLASDNDRIRQTSTEASTPTASTSTPTASTWILVKAREVDDEFDYHLDKSSIRFLSYIEATVTLKRQRKSFFGESSFFWYEIEVLHLQNGRDWKRYRRLSIAKYSMSGALIESVNTPTPWYVLPPDSVIEKAHSSVFGGSAQ
jgi:hypothetical protein